MTSDTDSTPDVSGMGPKSQAILGALGLMAGTLLYLSGLNQVDAAALLIGGSLIGTLGTYRLLNRVR